MNRRIKRAGNKNWHLNPVHTLLLCDSKKHNVMNQRIHKSLNIYSKPITHIFHLFYSTIHSRKTISVSFTKGFQGTKYQAAVFPQNKHLFVQQKNHTINYQNVDNLIISQCPCQHFTE